MSNDPQAGSDRAATFSGRVAVVFSTEVFTATIGIFNGILLARLLGPAAKGDYFILVLLPATALVLLQLGLPQAFGYFAARGQMTGLLIKTIVLTTALTVLAYVGVWVLIPLLRDAAFEAISLNQILFAFCAFPLALYATFATSIVLGRRAVRWYAGVNAATSLVTTVLLVLILGGLGPSVTTALAVYLLTIAVQSIGFALGARRVGREAEPGERVSYGSLFGYALKFYPASVTGFFGYRIDAYLIALLMANPSAPLGYYSMAVGLAEMVFFFPRAVGSMFFPHVAGTARAESDRHVAIVSRMTLLLTAMFAILLVPAAGVMIALVLPAFAEAFPALIVLLPGVVMISASSVLGGYLRGIERPGITSAISLACLMVNVVANIVLIPRYGIVGAAGASLISYSLSAFLLTTVGAHLSGSPLRDFWLPRLDDVRYLLTTGIGLIRRAAHVRV